MRFVTVQIGVETKKVLFVLEFSFCHLSFTAHGTPPIEEAG
jgi:hypothetical protein